MNDYTKTVLEKAVQEGVKTVINISSQSVYGSNRIGVAVEETEVNPDNYYAMGKYSTELLTNSICKKINHSNIRMASLIGKDYEKRIINRLIRMAIEKGTYSISKSNMHFGYLDVEDDVDGIIKVVRSDR